MRQQRLPHNYLSGVTSRGMCHCSLGRHVTSCMQTRHSPHGPSACQGTWTPLHADVLRSFSWSTNVTGRKRWRLLAPQHTHLLYDRFGREMAPSFFSAPGSGVQRMFAALAPQPAERLQHAGDATCYEHAPWGCATRESAR